MREEGRESTGATKVSAKGEVSERGREVIDGRRKLSAQGEVGEGERETVIDCVREIVAKNEVSERKRAERSSRL